MFSASRNTMNMNHDNTIEEVLSETPRVSLEEELRAKQRRTLSLATDYPWYNVTDSETDRLIIDLYSRGLSTRQIVNHLAVHGIEMAQPAVSAVTDKVAPLIKEWQTRILPSKFYLLYLDGTRFVVKESGRAVTKVAYIAMGIDPSGNKEILGIWLAESEGAKFWMTVLNEIKNRGVDDILITCVDGLPGFGDAIRVIYPDTVIQRCIIHQIRNTVQYISGKDRRAFCSELRSVYGASSQAAGLDALGEQIERWPQYAALLELWRKNWNELSPFFEYPEKLRRIMYTTNMIERFNAELKRRATRMGTFPHDESLIKLLWLIQADVTSKWTMRTRNWGEILGIFSVLFPDRAQLNY